MSLVQRLVIWQEFAIFATFLHVGLAEQKFAMTGNKKKIEMPVKWQ